MKQRPNIIFYFSDQQRWDTLGCYGQKLPVTPNLDRLAREGAKFQNAFTCQPVCGPARACLQTGKYATQVGCHTNGISLPLQAHTLAQYFNEAGYDTAYVGKWHLASDEVENQYQTSAIPPQRRGGYKDYWMAADVLEFTSHGYNGHLFDGEGNKHEFTGYRADCVNNFAIDYLHNRKSQNPFFLFVSQIEPHHQNDHACCEGPDGSKERFQEYEVPGDLAGTQGNWRENYPDYLGCCNSLDQNVGRLMDTLQAMGLADNTIVFYTADHGSHFCTRNKEYKRSCHDGCTHIPLVAWGGAFSGVGTVEQMVSLLDLPATVLSCAGIPVPDDFQGKALDKLVTGGAAQWPDTIFMQISESQVGRAIRSRSWKYSVRADADSWQDAGTDTYYEDFLYDLERDPHERNNLAGDPQYATVRAQLADKLIQRMVAAGEAVPKILPYAERKGRALDSPATVS
ncbi:MAG: sulfatase-like hydrolase/transferase [Angelakisella sp.]